MTDKEKTTGEPLERGQFAQLHDASILQPVGTVNPASEGKYCRICGSPDHEADGDQWYDLQEDGRMPTACRSYLAEQKRLSRPAPTAEEVERAIETERKRAESKLDTYRGYRNLTGALDDSRHEETRILWTSAHFVGREVVDWDKPDKRNNPTPVGYTLKRK